MLFSGIQAVQSFKAIFFALILISSISVVPFSFALSPEGSLLPPRKQSEMGTSFDQVKCLDGFVLMKKKSDNSPACLKPQSAQKLVERGWGVMVASTTFLACNGDNRIPYSYSLPCELSAPQCPGDMTFSNGVCTTTPPYTPPTPAPSQCDPNTGVCSSQGIAYPSCTGEFSGNICEPNSLPCPTGLQGDTFGTACNYSPPVCSEGYSVTKISVGSYSCQPTNPPLLSNASSYSKGEKVGAFTIAAVNQNNVTGYYNSPYPIERPGLGAFTIMHVGDVLNPTCDGSAPLVITAINFPDSITVSAGKSSGGSPGGGLFGSLLVNDCVDHAGKINGKEKQGGMLLWFEETDYNRVEAKVIKINRVFVGNEHRVIDLKLVDGRELFASPNHPTYDGRKIADLRVGEAYDKSTVRSIQLVQYKHQFTYDVLTDSQTGDYFANGILVGSTLR